MTEILKSVSDELIATVRVLDHTIVRVEARERLPASGIVWSADGVIVTSSHGVSRESNIRVGLADGRTVPAQLAGRDPGTDLAVLRAQAHGLTVPAWAEPTSLAVGGLALALGRPGERVLATFGIISALDDGWRTPAGGFVDHYVQTDAAMYPGFSGGALVDAERRVVGLATSALVSGLSLAIPMTTVRRTVEALLAHRQVRRAYLGVTAQPAPLPEALRAQLGQEAGLLLTQVEPGSPAERSQLVQGDMLVRLDGQPLRSLADLMRVLAGSPGEETRAGHVPAQVVRAGLVRDVQVRIGERR